MLHQPPLQYKSIQMRGEKFWSSDYYIWRIYRVNKFLFPYYILDANIEYLPIQVQRVLPANYNRIIVDSKETNRDMKKNIGSKSQSFQLFQSQNSDYWKNRDLYLHLIWWEFQWFCVSDTSTCSEFLFALRDTK